MLAINVEVALYSRLPIGRPYRLSCYFVLETVFPKPVTNQRSCPSEFSVYRTTPFVIKLPYIAWTVALDRPESFATPEIVLMANRLLVIAFSTLSSASARPAA